MSAVPVAMLPRAEPPYGQRADPDPVLVCGSLECTGGSPPGPHQGRVPLARHLMLARWAGPACGDRWPPRAVRVLPP